MKFLVAVQHPQNFDASTESAATISAINALNKEMVAAGVREMAYGLAPIKEAKAVRSKAGEELVVTDGPYLETKEYMGGFWVLDVASLEEALEWGSKAVVACNAPMEVRQIFFRPSPGSN